MPSRRNDCFVAILLVVDDEAEEGRRGYPAPR